MTDRELLKAAAEAAGVRLANTKPGYPLFAEGIGLWDPITDDGDAFRLAVKLGIGLYFEKGKFVDAAARLGTGSMFRVQIGDAPLLATRRAIVMAAAAMAGKQ